MAQQELAIMLQRHGVDTLSLTPLLASEPKATYRLTTSGADAWAYWLTLRALVDETGFWPIVLGGDRDVEEYANGSWDVEDPTPDGLIEAGLRMDTQAWIRTRLAEYQPGPARGPWPQDAQPANMFTIPYDLRTGKPLPIVHVALVPTRLGWQAPAFLRYGGWNACPTSEEQVCMFKHWSEAFGAEPFGMARDRVEMRVNRPPTDQQHAIDLAREQYAYCNDIVDQGTETVDALAAGLLHAMAWYFWWD
jgi:hypothetical protein